MFVVESTSDILYLIFSERKNVDIFGEPGDWNARVVLKVWSAGSQRAASSSNANSILDFCMHLVQAGTSFKKNNASQKIIEQYFFKAQKKAVVLEWRGERSIEVNVVEAAVRGHNG